MLGGAGNGSPFFTRNATVGGILFNGSHHVIPDDDLAVPVTDDAVSEVGLRFIAPPA